MLFRQKFLEGIRDGTVTLAFRRWLRPSVRAASTLRTAVGELHIESVVPVSLEEISAEDALRAGYESRDALLRDLALREEGTFYRIELGTLQPDRRIALRESPAKDEAESMDLVKRLRRLDARAADGPWTGRVLQLLQLHPGVRAGNLCKLAGQEKAPFKINVRKLKNLGLTESLEVGYRLSPRGEALLKVLLSNKP
jgi:hypothetical protein